MSDAVAVPVAARPSAAIKEAPAPADASTQKYIRGSGLLLAGRLISILLNLAVQVLTVRYLSKDAFGAFAYGLGVASIGSSVVLLGLGKAVPRFVPIYQERRDYARAFGTIALAVATIAGLSLSLIVLLFGLRGMLAEKVISDPLTLSLLLVLIALVPLNAFDHLLQNLVAIFSKPRAIFLRRHVLGPVLKLAAVLLVIAVAGDVYLLAVGYVVGGAIGIYLYVAILMREWRRQDLLQHVRLDRLELPAREVFGFSIPLLSAELPVLLRGSVAIILLEFFHNASAVAEYRAVYPIAALNLIVYQAFGFLFVPLASRMFARADKTGISNLYWQTSIWIVVLTFPVFALTCALATPLTVLLFGSAYQSAGVLMAVLALGYYFNAALGFNAETLRVYGKVRSAVTSDIVAAVVFLALCVVLIPRYNAVGAAIGATMSAIVHNLCNHAGLWIGGTGIRLPQWRFVRVFLISAGLIIALLIVQQLNDPPLYAGIALATVASLALLRLARHLLEPETTFPELMRVSWLRRLLT
jgi:O-antigen/teichoic acid export membrane protein